MPEAFLNRFERKARKQYYVEKMYQSYRVIWSCSSGMADRLHGDQCKCNAVSVSGQSRRGICSVVYPGTGRQYFSRYLTGTHPDQPASFFNRICTCSRICDPAGSDLRKPAESISAYQPDPSDHPSDRTGSISAVHRILVWYR